jgi:hypothetical protein
MSLRRVAPDCVARRMNGESYSVNSQTMDARTTEEGAVNSMDRYKEGPVSSNI